jgi:hypothetical protein
MSPAFIQLFEAQSLYYHETSYEGCDKILRDNVFLLSPSFLRKSDAALNAEDKPYSLSLSRNPANRYRGSYPNCTLVLDGQKLSSNYSIKSVNYWDHAFDVASGGSEMEDRLMSSEGVIPNARKFILEVHCFTGPLRKEEIDELPDSRVHVFWNLTFTDKYAPPSVYFYENQKDLYHLRRSKAQRAKDVDYELFNRKNLSSKSDDQLLKMDAFISFLETGKGSKHHRERLRYPRDWLEGGECDFHNFYRVITGSGFAGQLLARRINGLMRDLGVKNIRDLLTTSYERFRGKPFPI